MAPLLIPCLSIPFHISPTGSWAVIPFSSQPSTIRKITSDRVIWPLIHKCGVGPLDSNSAAVRGSLLVCSTPRRGRGKWRRDRKCLGVEVMETWGEGNMMQGSLYQDRKFQSCFCRLELRAAAVQRGQTFGLRECSVNTHGISRLMWRAAGVRCCSCGGSLV